MIGGIREDYCITHDGRVISGVIGGNAVYAAVGARLWSNHVSLISRIGQNFPMAWLDELGTAGINTSGVRIMDQDLDTRTFYAYTSLEDRVDTDPILHFARWGLPLPEALKDYHSSTEGQGSRDHPHHAAIRLTDIPTGFLREVKAAHLSPADYLTHLTFPGHLREHGVKLVTLDPSVRYMSPKFKLDLPNILSGINAFLPSVYEAASFASIEPDSMWTLTDLFHSMGASLIVIKAGADGQYLSDGEHNRRWHIPAYPSRVVDVTGAGDAFCGAFLTGLIDTGDPLEAALRGNIAASFVIEGTGALYALDTPARLLQARIAEQRRMVRKE